MNPSACPVAVKPQELLDPALVGLDGARSQSPYFARSFVLVNGLHALHTPPRTICSVDARSLICPIPLKRQQDPPLPGRLWPPIINAFLFRKSRVWHFDPAMIAKSEPGRMRFRSRLSTLLVAVGAIAIFLAAWLDWMAERGPGAYLAGAAGAALAALVFAALRPSSGYYRLRPFEASGEFYARLGVRFFRRFVPGGDYFNRLIRRTVPDFRVVRSPGDVARAERSGRFYERVHASFFVFLLPPTCWGLVCGQYGLAAEQILFNGLVNLYPAMLQRYTRSRLDALARRRERLQNRCGGG
jgi:hypothetical protein